MRIRQRLPKPHSLLLLTASIVVGMRRSRVRCLLVSIGVFLVCRPTLAQQPPPAAGDATSLAKETQNPVSSLITVPLQFNFNSGGDLGDGTIFNLNFQPVIPFKATSDINVIARTIV